ncbi:Endoglucanase C-terminal domain/subunit and related protein [Hahella chejuensis KCTC 2396]|uniref:Endoglucanase C-terminal domain/subunit and related protein n=1 Tax=Hahella chejuensis (strain KCTC 2396) TaxID=349521 RepID=Q2SG15_HAHCH|nr:expansin EXLX1 family cellulose-binding protein [Hahella chejuensis]ABC30409.1 Endoglucanase C-terminal domain/subunit and related protein [Hahella chejuensis KCTC 2396]
MSKLTFLIIGSILLLLCVRASYAENRVSATHTSAALHEGEGTYYFYNGGGHCSVPVPAMFTAAMNQTDYNGSQACGGCVKVTNRNNGKSVVARVDDSCPGCNPGDVDLTDAAFAQISPLEAGRIPISWDYVPCDYPSVLLYFMEGSSQWWTAVQVREQRYPVSSLAYRESGSTGSYQEIAREDYNYFVERSGMGTGPFDFRITDIYGHVLEAGNITLQSGVPINTQQQFPSMGTSGVINQADK